jgi:hypothetical protein
MGGSLDARGAVVIPNVLGHSIARRRGGALRCRGGVTGCLAARCRYTRGCGCAGGEQEMTAGEGRFLGLHARVLLRERAPLQRRLLRSPSGRSWALVQCLGFRRSAIMDLRTAICVCSLLRSKSVRSEMRPMKLAKYVKFREEKFGAVLFETRSE